MSILRETTTVSLMSNQTLWRRMITDGQDNDYDDDLDDEDDNDDDNVKIDDPDADDDGDVDSNHFYWFDF